MSQLGGRQVGRQGRGEHGRELLVYVSSVRGRRSPPQASQGPPCPTQSSPSSTPWPGTPPGVSLSLPWVQPRKSESCVEAGLTAFLCFRVGSAEFPQSTT